MKFQIVCFTCLAMLGAMVVAYLGIVRPFVYTSTRYAPGFSEVKFKKIKIGDSAAKVMEALGQPFGLSSAESTGIVWWTYSIHESHFTHPMFYRKRQLVISNSVVVER
jgi:hypothetical protein